MTIKDSILSLTINIAIPSLAMFAAIFKSEPADNFFAFFTIVFLVASIFAISEQVKRKATSVIGHLSFAITVGILIYAGWSWSVASWCFVWVAFSQTEKGKETVK